MLRVPFDDFLVLTMRGNQARRLAEKSLQNGVLIHQHIAGAGTHKQFHAAYRGRVGLHNLVQIVVRRADVERVVGQRFLGGKVELILQQRLRGGLRHRVGHLHKGGDAARHRRPALTANVSLGSHSRFPEMHMLVNDPGNHVFAPRINNLRIARIKRFSIADNFGNDTIFNIKVSRKGLTFVHYRCIFDIIVHL